MTFPVERALLSAVLGLYAQHAAAAPDVTNLLTARYGFGVDANRVQSLSLSWKPEVRWDIDGEGRVTGIGRLRVQAEQGMQLSGFEKAAYARLTGPSTIGDESELELRELYYSNRVGAWYLTLGKQQVVWGKADGLKVLDVVDPQSYREFILEDFDESRIPLWTVNVERPLGDWTLQLLWLPDLTGHAVPDRNATYAFRSPRLVPQPVPGVTVRLADPVRPDGSIQNGDAGLRISGFSGGWDLTLNYLYQYDHQAALHQVIGSGPTITVTPRYHRTHVLGGSFSRAFGDWVARGEFGYFSDRYFLTTRPGASDGLDSSGEISYVLGADWSGITDTFISLQFFQSRLSSYRDGISRPEIDTSTTFLMRRHFANETRTAEVLWIANANDGDGVVRPKYSYDLADDIRLWIGADLFYGPRRGLFGQFDDNDRLSIGVELGF